MSSPFHTPDSPGTDGTQSEGPLQPRNPLLCFLCDDYYSEPCLLSCYHTFCSRCLRGKEIEGKLNCPLCGLGTHLKEGANLPPADILMRQLIELSNAENPPCANCDKRDKASMYFCSTCGQALCSHCRENTHRAKMFSTHDVVHMSKCSKEGHRRCAVHGEQYIMFSNSQKNMLCVNCFRDTPAEARLHCVDIDTAYTQGCKKLDRAILSVCDLQNSVREGLLMFKNLLEELRHNMEMEKHTINSFCQGMQEAIAKTHANMIMEVQRQFETKERQFRNHLISLGTVLPLLQLHLLLCSTFSVSANKYQFLDLAYPMMDRLAAVSQLSQPLRPVQSSQIRTNYRSEFSHSLEPWVGKTPAQSQLQQQSQDGSTAAFEGSQSHPLSQSQQQSQSASSHAIFHPPPSRRQHSALRAKALEGEGPFSNHCRSFDTQIKELSNQLCGVKERLGELHRDVTLLRRAHTPPLGVRYEHVTRECSLLEEQLERHQVELERLKNVFDTLWEEQLCRIHVEQEIFQSQINDILNLRSEVKHLNAVAHQLEPYVKSLVGDRAASQATSDSVAQEATHQLQSLLEQMSALQVETAGSFRSDAVAKGECKIHPCQLVTSPTAENIIYMKAVDGKEIPVREVSRQRVSRDQAAESGNMVYGGRQQQQFHQVHQIPSQSAMSHSIQGGDPNKDVKRGVLSQLIEKVRTKEDRKKSPVQEDTKIFGGRDRSRSDGRGTSINPENIKAKVHSSSQGDESKQSGLGGGGKVFRSGKSEPTIRYGSSSRDSSSKAASLYHTITGKVLGSRESERTDLNVASDILAQSQHLHHIPPPPPPTSARRAQSHQDDLSSTSDFISSVGCMDVRERLESHLKEKLQDMMGRSALVGRIIRPGSVTDKCDDKGILSNEEGEYQRISDATTTSPISDVAAKQAVRALVHREPSTVASTPTSPRKHRDHVTKMVRLHPASDTEDSVFYASNDKGSANKTRKQNSCESLTLSTVSVNSRRSSMDLGDRKTLVVVIGTSKGAQARLIQKQRSWETFPPKKRGVDDDKVDGYRKFKDPDSFRSGFQCRGLADVGSQGNIGARGEGGGMKKADSFEGHEEAVRTLVAAVQETRSQHLHQQRKQSHPKSSSS